MTALAEPQTRRLSIAVTILRSLLTLLFFVAAGVSFVAYTFEVTNVVHFGSASWLMNAIGVVELAGAIFLARVHARGLAALANPAAVTLALCLVVAYAQRSDLGSITCH